MRAVRYHRTFERSATYYVAGLRAAGTGAMGDGAGSSMLTFGSSSVCCVRVAPSVSVDRSDALKRAGDR